MLYIIFALIFICPTALGFGVILESVFGIKNKKISMKLLSGTFCITFLWTLVAFFHPLSLWIELITLSVGFAAFFSFKNYRYFFVFLNKQNWSFFLAMLAIIFLSSYFPFILDHFGYYVPTIQWISQVGLVKGIANLDLLLGQMSLWHIFQAGFSLFSDPFLRINAFVLSIYLIFIFEKKSWAHLAFLPVLSLFSQSPSPDLPVIAFSMILLDEILSKNKNIGWVFSLSIFIFAIKPTMLWPPLFAMLYGFFILKRNVKFLVPGSIILFLFFIKNFYCFGFPIFPVQAVDLGIPWKPNPTLLKISSEVAIQKTFDMQYTPQEIKNFSSSQYFWNWLFLKGIKGFINKLLIISILLMLIFTIYKRNKIITLLFLSVFIKTLLIILFSAQYRFFLDVFFITAYMLCYRMVTFRKSYATFLILNILIISGMTLPNILVQYIPSFRLGRYMAGFRPSQVYKPSYFEIKKYKAYHLGNLKFNVTNKYPYCFDTPPPAISPSFLKEDLDAGIFPQKNSEKLSDGFHWRKLSLQEKAQLEKIVSEHAGR